ncbi:hypothetical protein DM02DRAFT_656731 [Periconia macrospinosa]|uniref:Zn(2)-C6 fungal-type domain-containing protein n=1 Tax=Periconia macrospinosa TaxID=97972 RepID=A0A2V1DLF1_9PLEO|nr:hypothetical protein DM02DRAFT_656731 [Periconia macrospinosa]
MPAVPVSRFQDGPERKRKPHAKSRKGCGNCKLRRVKCDETKPRCKRCAAYGVSCDYDGSRPSLDLAAQGSFQVDLFHQESSPSAPTSKPKPNHTPTCHTDNAMIPAPIPAPEKPPSVRKTVASMVNASLQAAPPASDSTSNVHQVHYWTFTEEHLDILKRFQERTVSTIGNSQTAPTYRDCISHLTFSHPFLMHMVLSLTLMHDAHLSTPHSEDLGAKYHHASLQHWNTATKLFKHVLSNPIPPSYRDAVWATGALLGAASFAYVEASKPEQAWPLKPSEPTDLDWLKLSEGKKAIWQVADPTRPDSIFHGIALKMTAIKVSDWVAESDLSFLPHHLKQLFGITPQSTPQNNVYCLPIIMLSRLHGLTPNSDNVVEFLLFMALIPPDFKNMLEIKDPRALLLLLWWFRKLEHGDPWWLIKRAKLEGRAVEMWLETYYGGEAGLTRMYASLGQMHHLGQQALPKRSPVGASQDASGRQGRDEGAATFPPSVESWIKDRSNAGCPVQ